jgi:inhibitor of cysteine peptidase
METKITWQRAAAGAIALVLLLALVANLAGGCASANAAGGPLKLTQADNGKAFAVKEGSIIEVVLPGNMTTGFAWVATLAGEDAALLVQDGEPAYAEQSTDPKVVGAGGTFTFKFKAATAGQATLKLVYERSWENVAPEQTYEVQITIE